MGGIDIGVIGMCVAAVAGIGSFVVSRRLHARRAAKRRQKETVASRAIETRQVRRARERKERGG